MKYSDLNNITTIAEALQALEDVTVNIEQIKLHLEFPNDESPEWRKRAEYALKKNSGIKNAITARLAVLRQEDKQRRLASSAKHAELLIEEMKRYFPRSAFLACDHRAKMKLEVENG